MNTAVKKIPVSAELFLFKPVVLIFLIVFKMVTKLPFFSQLHDRLIMCFFPNTQGAVTCFKSQ